MTKELSKVFLSHSSDDAQLVRSIKRELSRFWTYLDEDCFNPGEDFRDAIVSRISESDLFVLFASEKSLASTWVKFEIDEAYWNSIKRDVKVIVLSVDNISKADLPSWMQRLKFEKVISYKIAAQTIRNAILETIPDLKPVYLGREDDTSRFYREFAGYQDPLPHVFAIIGLNGIGRKTFITHVMEQRFQLPHYSLFEIAETDGIIELFRKILDDNPRNYAPVEKEKCYNYFNALDEKDKIKEVVTFLSVYAENRSYPILIDNGGLLDDNGNYNSTFSEILRLFSQKYQDRYLCLLHTRKPRLSRKEQEYIFMLRLSSLKDEDSYAVLDALIKQRDIVAETKQIKEIASFLDGYPPAIKYAAKECSLEGVDVVCNDKRILAEYKAGIFNAYIDRLRLSGEALSILELLYNLKHADTRMISTIHKRPFEEAASEVTELIDVNLIEHGTDNLYAIAPPIKASIKRRIKHYGPAEYSVISKELVQAYLDDKENTISFSYMDGMIRAILLSGENDKYDIIQGNLLPSHFMEAAKEKYDQRDWVSAEKYARNASELDPDLVSAKELLFQSLVRQETSQDRKRFDEEENHLLPDIERNRGMKSVCYLKGFRFLKRKQYRLAIEQLELAIEYGNQSIPAYRDLAESYYQVNNITEAQKQINLVMKKRKIENPYIIDMAAKIAIAQKGFLEAEDYLRKLEIIDRPESVAHRWASYYLKKGDFDNALMYAEAACRGERVRPEMHLMRMNIAVQANKPEIVEEEYQKIPKNFRHYNKEVLEVIYTTMLLKTKGWKRAEAHFSSIKGNSPYIKNLRKKIICEKLKDDFPGFEKTKLEAQLSDLQHTFDPLSDFQCFDYQ